MTLLARYSVHHNQVKTNLNILIQDKVLALFTLIIVDQFLEIPIDRSLLFAKVFTWVLYRSCGIIDNCQESADILESNNALLTAGPAVNYLHGFLRPILDRNRNRNFHFEVDQRFGVEENIKICPKFLVVLAPAVSPQDFMSKETIHLDYYFP